VSVNRPAWARVGMHSRRVRPAERVRPTWRQPRRCRSSPGTATTAFHFLSPFLPGFTSERAQVDARYGPPASRTVRALARCLGGGDPGVVGVLAGLATVDDEPLARLLSTAFRGMLDVLVIRCPNPTLPSPCPSQLRGRSQTTGAWCPCWSTAWRCARRACCARAAPPAACSGGSSPGAPRPGLQDMRRRAAVLGHRPSAMGTKGPPQADVLPAKPAKGTVRTGARQRQAGRGRG
jgi:hypothetical protein